MLSKIHELMEALNPWYWLYLAIFFGAAALSGTYSGLFWFLCGLSVGLYIKNHDAWNTWL